MSEQPELKRSLGLIDATSIVAGSMIGSGIFIVSAQMSRDLGSAGYLILAWLITGLITVFAALSYGELAGMMPKAGGQYVYIQRAFGKPISFLYGWTVFMVIQTGVIAAVAVTFANYTSVFIPSLNKIFFEFPPGSLNGDVWQFKITYAQLFAIASVIFLTFLNSRGVKNGKTIQTVFTSAKLLALFALIILGIGIGMKSGMLMKNFEDAWHATKIFFNKDDGRWHLQSLTGLTLLGAMGATLINSLFSSDAWNNVTFIAGEIKDPKKNIPRSLFLGTFIVTILYILANVAYLSLLPLNGDPTSSNVVLQNGIQFAINDRVGTAAADMIFGNSAVAIMAALIMVSTFGCNNGIILSGARLYYAMSKDGLFFKRTSDLNKFSVPSFALWIQCAWASVLCLSGKYGDLLTYSTFASLLFYILTIAGIFVLRKKEPNAERPYKAFGYPLIPALYILVVAAICFDLLYYSPMDTGIGLGIVLLGLPVYFITRPKTSAA